MAMSMTGSGLMDRNMVMVFGKMFPETVISVSGDGIWRMAMEFILGKMKIAMRANGCTLLDMVKVLIFLRMGTSSWESMFMELHKVLDNINGQMETTIAVISLMGRSRVRGYGGSQRLIFQQISLKVPFLMI